MIIKRTNRPPGALSCAAASLSAARPPRSARRGRPGARAIAANQPPNVADWTRLARRRRRRTQLWQTLQARSACHPPRRRMAHRLARKLGQLHAAARARRHHHAERTLLRAPPRRHRRARSGRLPADPPRPGRKAADLHARRSQAHAARQPRLFLRMRGEFRHGMAGRAAQRLPIHPWHGALRDVHRRAAESAAGRSGPQAERRDGCCWKAAMPPR